MNLEELDKLFEDPANRPWGVFYHCPSDPRVIAPSRPTWRGHQINFAHPRAFLLLVFYLALLLCPVSLAFTFGPGNPGALAIVVVLVFAASVTFLIALSVHLSKQHAS
jgi:hypothetical protein